jgi:hypothetical protein
MVTLGNHSVLLIFLAEAHGNRTFNHVKNSLINQYVENEFSHFWKVLESITF